MDSFFKPKIISIIAFALFIVCVIWVFAQVRNLSVENAVFFGNNIYAAIILLIISVTVLFVIALKVVSTYDDQLRTIDVEMDVLATNSETPLTEEVEITNDIKIKEPDKIKIITRILSEQEGSIKDSAEKILKNLAHEFEASVAIFYLFNQDNSYFEPIATYAYFAEKDPVSFKEGETLCGQCVKNRAVLNLNELPEGYITIASGLGSTTPSNLLILPVIYEENPVAVIELGSLKAFSKNQIEVLKDFAEVLSKNIIVASNNLNNND